MVVKVFCGYDNNEHQSEWRQFKEIVEIIKSEYQDSGELVYVLGNLIIGNNEFDAIILRQSGIAIFELKAYKGQIIGSQNGNWYVRTKRGQIPLKARNNNLFIQLRSQKYTLLDTLNEFQADFLTRINRFELGKLKCWGYFLEGSSYDLNQIDPKVHIWFNVITSSSLIENMRFLQNNFLLLEEEMDLIIENLILKECKGLENLPSDQINDTMSLNPENKVSKRRAADKKSMRGAPPKNPRLVLEVWIDCIERISHIDEYSGLSENHLRELLRRSELYKKNPDRYKYALDKRLPKSLETGEQNGIFSRFDEKWSLNNAVKSIIKSRRFKEERKNDYFKSIYTLVDKIRREEWMEYYETVHRTPIEIPPELKPYIFEFKDTEQPPSWFNPNGIGLQEYNAGFYPKKLIRLLRIQVENTWKKRKAVVLFANPAQGKTTSASVLLQEWKKSSENNICMMIPSTEWEGIFQNLEALLHKYRSDPSYQFILVVENIHLIWPKFEKINTILSKSSNVRLLATSRVSQRVRKGVEEKSVIESIEILDFPKNYGSELIWTFLEFNNIDPLANKSQFKSLVSENQHRNILYIFSKIERYF